MPYKKTTIAFLFVLLIIGGVFYLRAQVYYSHSSSVTKKMFEIQKGEGNAVIAAKLEAEGFKVILLKHFNRIGILGWFLNGKILMRKKLPSFQLRIYNLLVPLFKLEELFPLPFGTSLIAIAERPE